MCISKAKINLWRVNSTRKGKRDWIPWTSVIRDFLPEIYVTRANLKISTYGFQHRLAMIDKQQEAGWYGKKDLQLLWLEMNFILTSHADDLLICVVAYSSSNLNKVQTTQKLHKMKALLFDLSYG